MISRFSQCFSTGRNFPILKLADPGNRPDSCCSGSSEDMLMWLYISTRNFCWTSAQAPPLPPTQSAAPEFCYIYYEHLTTVDPFSATSTENGATVARFDMLGYLCNIPKQLLVGAPGCSCSRRQLHDLKLVLDHDRPDEPRRKRSLGASRAANSKAQDSRNAKNNIILSGGRGCIHTFTAQ